MNESVVVRIEVVLFIALLAPALFAGPNIVSEPVGFVRIDIAPNSHRLVSIPFDAFDSSLNEVLRGQLTGSREESSADAVLKWTPSEARYESAIKADGTGDEAIDGKWFKNLSMREFSEIEIVPGEGFFIHNKQSVTQTVFLCGTVVLSEKVETGFVPGLNLFGYPYASGIAMEDTALGDLMSAQDVVYDGLANKLNPSDLLMLGKGYWLDHKGDSVLTGSEARPYANLFPSNGEPPRIASMNVNDEHNRVTLRITCAGAHGERLDIMFQDIDADKGFVSAGAWALAARALDTNGRLSVEWTDVGSDSRCPVSDVVARCYLVARADIDTDGDGVSDAREIFVHNTDPADAGSHPCASAAPLSIGVDTAEIVDAPGGSAEQPRGQGALVCVNIMTGSDSYDGRAELKFNGNRGPKKTVKAGLAVTEPGDTIKIFAGVYKEGDISFCGRGVNVVFSGNVSFR